MSPHMPRQPEPEYMNSPAEADAYAAADFADVNQAFVDRLLELAGPAERATAVDLGTGPGDIPIRLARVRPGWHITAVDASEAMLDHARRAAAAAGLTNAIEWLCADAKSTPLPEAAFDVVFSNSILHHVTDTDAFWTELKRLAAPGALVLLRDLTRPRDEASARAIVARYAGGESRLLQEEFFRSLLSSWTPQEVRRQLDRADLGALAVAMVTDRHWDVFGHLQ